MKQSRQILADTDEIKDSVHLTIFRGKLRAPENLAFTMGSDLPHSRMSILNAKILKHNDIWHFVSVVLWQSIKIKTIQPHNIW